MTDFTAIFNDEKTRKNITIGNDILNLPENQKPRNEDDLEVSTIVPGKSKIDTTAARDQLRKKIVREKLDEEESVSSSESSSTTIISRSTNVSDNDSSSILSENNKEEQINLDDNESEISDIDDKRRKRDESDKKRAVKRSMIIELGRLEQKGCKVNRVSYKDSIEDIEAELEKARDQVKFKIKIKFFRFMIYAFAWITEKVLVRIGYAADIEGWSNHVRQEIEQYDQFFEEMVKPQYIHHSDGTVVKIENKSIMNKITSNTEVNLFGTLAISAIFYAGANRFVQLSTYFPETKSNQITKRKKYRRKKPKKQELIESSSSESEKELPKETVPKFSFLENN